MARRYKFERILEELKKCNTKAEIYRNLGISKQQFYNYLRLMKDKGILDENYNIIYQKMDYTSDNRFNKDISFVVEEVSLEEPKEGNELGFDGEPVIKLKNSREYEEYARKRKGMTFEELYNCNESKFLRGEL